MIRRCPDHFDHGITPPDDFCHDHEGMLNRFCIIDIVKRWTVHLLHQVSRGRGMSRCIHREMEWRGYWRGGLLELWSDCWYFGRIFSY